MQIRLCYFNQHWNIYLYTNNENDTSTRKIWYDNKIDEKRVPKVEKNGLETGEYRLRTYGHPDIPQLCSFGFWYYDEFAKFRPGHGGEWSSNSGAINPIFGTDLYEVGLDGISMAVSLKWLKEIMGDQVTWELHDIYGEWITDVKGVANDYMAWTTIPNLLQQV